MPHLLDGEQRPADIWLPVWDKGQPAALDLAVTSPLQQNILAKAAVTCGEAGRAYEAVKLSKSNASDCAARGINFIPMVVESFGGWAPQASVVLNRVSKLLAERQSVPRSTALRRLHQRLSVTLQRANARSILIRDKGLDLATANSASSAELALAGTEL